MCVEGGWWWEVAIEDIWENIILKQNQITDEILCGY